MSNVQDKNAVFYALPREVKRQVVAADAILQILSKKIVPVNGTYFQASKKSWKHESGTEYLQQLLANNQIESCRACAMGTIFAAKVSSFNDCKTRVDKRDSVVYADDADMFRTLSGIFGKLELRKIEAAFEKMKMSSDDRFTDSSLEEVEVYANMYPYDKDGFSLNPAYVIVDILLNIIINSRFKYTKKRYVESEFGLSLEAFEIAKQTGNFTGTGFDELRGYAMGILNTYLPGWFVPEKCAIS